MKKQLLVLYTGFLFFFSITNFAQEALQNFTLINKTGVVIHSVFISPNDSENWEEDILGQDVLGDGEECEVKFSPLENICLWDLKISDSDGNEIMWQDIDLCKWLKITLHWDGKKATATFEE